jgi:hypothetical protein
MDAVELRDHAEEMLLEIAEDPDCPQSDAERQEKSRGYAGSRSGDSAASATTSARH